MATCVSPGELVASFDRVLGAEIFRGTAEQNGWFVESKRAVESVGLALEPWAGLEGWAERERLGAVFLHRPWKLTGEQIAALQKREVGVLAYHLAFDERLTTGFNPVLARRMGWGEPTVSGYKEQRPLGMRCQLAQAATFAAVAETLRQEFGGMDDAVPPKGGDAQPIEAVAVVGAMNEVLVREAADRGVGVYVTGQWRQPASRAVRETGIGMVVLGHRRTEEWGLRTLRDELRTQNPALQIVVAE